MKEDNIMSFKERFNNFMFGRNGADAFGFSLLFVTFALCLVNLFVNSLIIYILYAMVTFYTIWRMISRNVAGRKAENARFLLITGKLGLKFSVLKTRFRERKTHIYKKCPSCGVTLRLPLHKGQHSVRCPRCSSKFNIKI